MTGFGERVDHRAHQRRRDAVPLRTKSLHFLAREQTRVATYAKGGRSEHELFRAGGSGMRVTVVALRAGLQVGEGDSLNVPGTVVQVLRGVVRFGGRRPTLIACPGDLIMLVDRVNTLRAETDVVVLVTSPTAAT